MYRIFNGQVISGYSEGPGNLILTPSSVYVLKNGERPGLWTAFGGVIGIMITKFISRKIVEDSPPAFLDDLELVNLSKKERRTLLTAEVLVKYDRCAPSFSVTPTTFGFAFYDGITGARYDGLLHKKKIAQFLAV